MLGEFKCDPGVFVTDRYYIYVYYIYSYIYIYIYYIINWYRVRNRDRIFRHKI